MKRKKLYNKKFSIGHWDNAPSDDIFLKCIEGATEQHRREIYDIYFGATFRFRFSEKSFQYGNTMGVNATPDQYKNLLKIQEKYGIPLSLTLNEMNRPIELLSSDTIKEFILFIKKYYDDGIRSCTISHTHLMKLGALQEAFPSMNWKNTVNHGIKTTQEFIDYCILGYNTIQLDRSFNRNINELKLVSVEAERLKVKTCLLIQEDCMPECPFKTEHDCWQSGEALVETKEKNEIFKLSYWDQIPFTCNEWRNYEHENRENRDSYNPRTETNIVARSQEDWKEYAELVDIFKISGRLKGVTDEAFPRKAYWVNNENSVYEVGSFKEIYENNIMPIHIWFRLNALFSNKPIITDIEEIKKGLESHFWNREKSINLVQTLKKCENQCYKCHKCDEVFETGHVDSVLSLKARHIPTAKGISVNPRMMK